MIVSSLLKCYNHILLTTIFYESMQTLDGHSPAIDEYFYINETLMVDIVFHLI